MIPPRSYPPRGPRPRIRENVNEAIRAREVRAVFPDGSVEIMQTLAAVHKARELGLDLILIALGRLANRDREAAPVGLRSHVLDDAEREDVGREAGILDGAQRLDDGFRWNYFRH